MQQSDPSFRQVEQSAPDLESQPSLEAENQHPVTSQNDVPKHQDSPVENEHRHNSREFSLFLEEISSLQEVERKLERVIQFMESAISQTGAPHFKDFWDAKKMCLEFFKSNINSSVRVHLWAKYSELCREARRLKEIFDEQTAFAVEQIEMALKSVEDDLARISEIVAKCEPIQFVEESYLIKKNYNIYNEFQKELNVLNAYAAKTTSLRKELIKTEMRIRNKNRFFQRLSSSGDLIFPRRKELIAKISEQFKKDVDLFITTSFSHESSTPDLFDLREEIKALQCVAKQLTLNTEAFSHTRLSLSECWDSIKVLVQERKKAVHEQRTLFKQHKDAFHEELLAVKKALDEKTISTKACEDKIEDIATRMRTTELGKIEIRQLRDEIRSIRDLLFAKNRSEVDVETSQVREREVKNNAKLDELKKRVQEIKQGFDSLTNEQALEHITATLKQVAHLSFTDTEKFAIEKELHTMREMLSERKARAILALSTDDQEMLVQLRAMLQEQKSLKQEVKGRLESHRKTKGSSSLDFAEALQYNDVIEEEKDRLKKIEDSIDEIEEKIGELEG